MNELLVRKIDSLILSVESLIDHIQTEYKLAGPAAAQEDEDNAIRTLSGCIETLQKMATDDLNVQKLKDLIDLRKNLIALRQSSTHSDWILKQLIIIEDNLNIILRKEGVTVVKTSAV